MTGLTAKRVMGVMMVMLTIAGKVHALPKFNVPLATDDDSDMSVLTLLTTWISGADSGLAAKFGLLPLYAARIV